MTNRDWLRLAFGAGIVGLATACGPVTESGTQPAPTEPAITAEPSQAVTEAATEAATQTPAETTAPQAGGLETAGQDTLITSGGKDYKTYLAGPKSGGPYPGIVLIHSIKGPQPGYRTLTDKLAAEGFVVAAVDWQTFENQPSDAVVKQLTLDTIGFMAAEGDVDLHRTGLTGFCAGGRYTMLLLPQIKDFKAGVAWYGFPYSGETQPASLIDQLDAPMLIIHGTADQASPIANIHKYTDALKAAGKEYELKTYDGEPHDFMMQNGQMRTDAVGMDAFNRMVDYFKQKLG